MAKALFKAVRVLAGLIVALVTGVVLSSQTLWAQDDLGRAKDYLTSRGVVINAEEVSVAVAATTVDLIPLWRLIGADQRSLSEISFSCEPGVQKCEIQSPSAYLTSGNGSACLLLGAGWDYQAIFFRKTSSGYVYSGQVSHGIQKYGIVPDVRLFNDGIAGVTWISTAGSGLLVRTVEIYRLAPGQFKPMGSFFSEYIRVGWGMSFGEERKIRYEIQGETIRVKGRVDLLAETQGADKRIARKRVKIQLKIDKDRLVFDPLGSNIDASTYTALFDADEAIPVPVQDPPARAKSYYQIFKSEIDLAGKSGSGFEAWHAKFMEDIKTNAADSS